MVGSRLRRMRPYLELPRELWIQNFGRSWSRALERKGPCLYVCTDGSARAFGVGDCPRLLPTKSDPGRPQDHESTGFHRRARHGGTVNIASGVEVDRALEAEAKFTVPLLDGVKVLHLNIWREIIRREHGLHLVG